MRPAVTIASIERIPVYLTSRDLLQTVQEPETRQLPGLGTQPGGERVRSGIADQALQPLPCRNERSSTGSGRGGQHPTHSMELGTEYVGPEVCELDRRGNRCNLAPAAITERR